MTTVESLQRKQAVLAALQQSKHQPVSISRATDPALRDDLTPYRRVQELPTVGGRTVWATATYLRVVEQPNHWGWTTPNPEPTALIIDHRGLEPAWQARCELARKARKSLQTLPKVTLACGFDAPWFVALLPCAGGQVAAHLDPDFGTSAIADDRPELPGGLRVEVPPDVGSDWVASCVASIAAVMDSAIGDT